jgi:hypothetical protein
MAPEFGKSIHQLPLIPANVLKKHCVHEPLDARFRSAARMLQALWREDRAIPIGSYVNEDGKRRKLGSRISEAAGRAGGNFLTPRLPISPGARLPIARGAMIDAERLATNLLSSMPLTFNLLAPWGHSLERASVSWKGRSWIRRRRTTPLYRRVNGTSGMARSCGSGRRRAGGSI